MALNAGERLGSYEILSPLGAGGMGEVYRARDSKLGREVAIKVLPEEFTQHPQKLARFEREARLLAALNHPGIATLYGVEEESPQPERSAERSGVAEREAVGVGPRGREKRQPFLVMELVEGETLADRIARGAIPVDEALQISQQIAEALEAAHEKGVIHRDLKPANIKVDPEGKVKVLDFGLAKAFADEVPESELSQSPTLSRDATRAGVILGTAAYMSPEQAKGKTVDKRSDIFSFGIVLYEMLTGKRAFGGEDVSDVLAAIIRSEPDWNALHVGPDMAAVIRRCLEKDRKKRWRDIGDVSFALEESRAPRPASIATSPRRIWPTVIAVALAAGVLGAVLTRNLGPDAPRNVSRFAVYLPEGENFAFSGRRVIAFSPDGTHIAYVANWRLNLRALDDVEAVPLAGTGGSRTPFFSPDGQWIGFWAGSLQKVSVQGGPPVRLCEATNPFGASWAPDGTILFGQGEEGVWRVSEDGGDPEVVVEAEEGERAYGPELLPDGEHILYSVATGSDWDDAEIRVKSIDTGEVRVLVDGGSDARYVPTGHLVYSVDHTMLAVPFDVNSLELHGGPVPVIEGVARALAYTAATHASVSNEVGSLAYVSEDQIAKRTVVWVDRSGQVGEPLTAPANTLGLQVSPDGDRLALIIQDSGVQDVWILDVERNTLTRLTTDGAWNPVWSADGEWVVFTKGNQIYRKRSDFSGSSELLLESERPVSAEAYSSDGQWLVYREAGDLWALPIEREGEPQPLVQTPFSEDFATLSPDGRYMAYSSNESGRDEVYVTTFPEAGRKWPLSTGGGDRPMWSADGTEIFYLEATTRMMGSRVDASSDFKSSAPELLFETPPLDGPSRMRGVAPGAQRFATLRDINRESGRIYFNVVLNWHEELKRLVPVE